MKPTINSASDTLVIDYRKGHKVSVLVNDVRFEYETPKEAEAIAAKLGADLRALKLEAEANMPPCPPEWLERLEREREEKIRERRAKVDAQVPLFYARFEAEKTRIENISNGAQGGANRQARSALRTLLIAKLRPFKRGGQTLKEAMASLVASQARPLRVTSDPSGGWIIENEDSEDNPENVSEKAAKDLFTAAGKAS
jgi:hypothetical protein